jgi:hypothetical protein
VRRREEKREQERKQEKEEKERKRKEHERTCHPTTKLINKVLPLDDITKQKTVVSLHVLS